MGFFKNKKWIFIIIILVTLFIGLCGGILAQRVRIPRQMVVFLLERKTQISNHFIRQEEWARNPMNPIISPQDTSWDANRTGWGSILKDENKYNLIRYKYYYTGSKTDADQKIGLAMSKDGKNWGRYDGNPILRPGPSGAWDDWIVWCPMVWKEGITYHMLYSGSNTSKVYQVGYAFSMDGVKWIKYDKNPVFNDPNPWAHNKTEGWGLIKIEGTYYMYYSSLVPHRREIGVATSKDLINWTPCYDVPIFSNEDGYAYSQFCPWPFKYGNQYFLIISYQNRLDHYLGHSRFKLYRSSNPFFNLNERKDLGFILRTHPEIQWESAGCLDTPFILANDITMSTFPKEKLWMYYTAMDKTKRRHTGMAIYDLDSLITRE